MPQAGTRVTPGSRLRSALLYPRYVCTSRHSESVSVMIALAPSSARSARPWIAALRALALNLMLLTVTGCRPVIWRLYRPLFMPGSSACSVPSLGNTYPERYACKSATLRPAFAYLALGSSHRPPRHVATQWQSAIPCALGLFLQGVKVGHRKVL